jgi:hypothetical protein
VLLGGGCFRLRADPRPFPAALCVTLASACSFCPTGVVILSPVTAGWPSDPIFAVVLGISSSGSI